MPETSNDRAAVGPRSIVASALWRRRWLIVGCTVLAGTAGYLLSSLQPVTYTAHSQLILSATQYFDPLNSRSDLAPERFISDQVSVLTSDPVLQRAAGQLGAEQNASDLAGALDVTARADSAVIDIAAQARTGQEAVARANAVVTGYRAFVRAQVQQLADPAAASAGDPETAADIRTRAAAYGDGVAGFQAAELPPAPTQPKPARNALLLAMLAALVTTGVALWRRDQNTAEDARALAAQLEAPLLGIVPSSAGRSRRDRTPGAGFDMALAALDHVALGRSGPVMMTGLDRREGAAGVVLGLATVASRRRRVLVVDADVPGHSLVSISGATTPAAPLEDRLDAGELHRLVSAVPGQHGDGPAGLDLAVLGHGVLEERGDLAAVLHNLRLLSDQYDLVLVNAGRLVSDPSAFALLRAVGMVVLVAGGSRRLDPADVPEARRLLALAGRAIDALVFVAGPPSGRRRPSVSSRPSASPTPAAPAPAMSTRPGAATPAP